MGIDVVGIGDISVSKTTGTIIKTYALGSCVAVIIFDPFQKVGGMIHIALPDSSIDPKKAESKPGYFADTGIPKLVKQMESQGVNMRKTRIKLAGGSNIMDEKLHFNIGKRNVLAIKKSLWNFRLGPIAEDIDGSISRTVSLDLADGKVQISSQGKIWEL